VEITSYYHKRKHELTVHPQLAEKTRLHPKQFSVNFKLRVITRLEHFRLKPGSKHEFVWGAKTQVAAEFKINKSMVTRWLSKSRDLEATATKKKKNTKLVSSARGTICEGSDSKDFFTKAFTSTGYLRKLADPSGLIKIKGLEGYKVE
jgi:hypothetical protein